MVSNLGGVLTQTEELIGPGGGTLCTGPTGPLMVLWSVFVSVSVCVDLGWLCAKVSLAAARSTHAAAEARRPGGRASCCPLLAKTKTMSAQKLDFYGFDVESIQRCCCGFFFCFVFFVFTTGDSGASSRRRPLYL